MNMKHLIAAVIALVCVAPAFAQPVGGIYGGIPGGGVPGGVGGGVTGGPVGGPQGVGPINPPQGPGPIGPGPLGPGPLPLDLMDLDAMRLDLLDLGPMHLDLLDLGPMHLDLPDLGHMQLDLAPMAMDAMRLVDDVAHLVPDAMLLEPQDLDRERMERDRERQDRELERQEREREAEQREREREHRVYEQAQEALDQGRYDRAIERFGDVATMKGTRADAALYWKAFAQDRRGQRAEALTTIAELAKNYPNSRYISQAKALEVEVRRNVGQPVRPESQSDDEMKLLALQGLQNSDPERAIPMLEKLLQGTASPRLKDRALFVLAESNSPRAREVLTGIAKGNSTPELQRRAIQYLGVHGGRESRAALAEIYASSSDVDVKRRILRAFMVSGEKARLLTAAQTEKDPELRAEAVQQLGVMSAHDELWQLYQKETAVEVKKRILHAMFVGGNASRMIDLAKTEQNPELRRTAVHNLGLMDSQGTGQALVDIYGADRDEAVRKTVVNALFLQSNATALVALARKEQNPQLKKAIVQKLSLMDSKVATDYMLELLNGK